jgi:glycosyltransferase involved in cell wall biosynthesis
MPARNPQVSVVFPTRNRPRRVEGLLEALRRQELPGRTAFEVVAVDDGSSDETQALLQRAAAEGDLDLRFVRHDSPRGPAAARNAGWRATRAPLVAFTDDDCVPTPRWLSEGLGAAQAAPGAIVQGRTEPLPGELGELGPFSRTIEVTEKGPYYQTCNMFYPRDVLERLGGFDDEKYGVASGEDADLAWRAIEDGVPVEFAPEALVHHAVANLGPLGKLRVIERWSESMVVYKEHRGLRDEVFTHGIFWKGTHYLLVRALIGLIAFRYSRPFAVWLAYPYLRQLLGERRRQERASPLVAPYWVLHDLLEIAACLHASLRYRMLVL